MHYAEGPTAEVEVIVEAPIERVWEHVIDINLPARFSSEFQGAEWMDGGPGLGARFVGRNRHPALGEWQTTSWVNRYQPPCGFGWAVTDPENPSASWWFELEARAGGTTSLRQGARIGPAPSGLSIAIAARPDKEERIISRRLQELETNMRATVEGIKQLAQAAR